MGRNYAPPPFADIVHLTVMAKRLSIFPLTGAILFPGLQMPLHIFEPRYRALISDALVRDRRIAMIQPQRPAAGAPLFDIGCVGKIGDVEAMEDGRYNVVLEGETRFRMIRELDVTTPFRQIEAELLEEPAQGFLSSVERAGFEQEAKRFADTQGYSVDWDSVTRLDDMSLIDGVSQIAPFDPAAKQGLLEANTINERCELLVQLMQFYGRRDGDDEIITLQ